jgi:predicted O-methyltransferase YrrM
VYSCELDAGLAKIARDFVELAGLSDVVEVVEGKSTDSIKMLKEEHKIDHIDVLFLDHWESYYLPDLQLCEDLGLLRKGSIVLADNTDMPGAPDYVKYVKAGGRGNEGGMKLESKTYQAGGAARGPVRDVSKASLVFVLIVIRTL